LISSNAQAMPPSVSGFNTAIHQQTNLEQVRCRGRRCGRYYASRQHARPNAWEYSPLNTPYYWGSAVMGGGRRR
jgi:hypothetical protein